MAEPDGAAVPQLPFTAVVGQDQAKLALILAAVDPRIGGVLLRGEKGSAKSTLARGLAAVLPTPAPFVELPIGATEDRVVGSLDLTAAFTGAEVRFSAGLLAAADGGVLYVDEINLLPDHLVDALLDAAASGVNRVEREGISHTHSSRFLLIGSMNPEEGDLRPQLLDRFGLAVEIRAGTDPRERAAAVRRRLAFDVDPAAVAAAVAAEEAGLASRLAAAVPGALPDEVVESVASLCVSMGAEGLRADLTICRAAAALSGWEGRPVTSLSDVRRVAPLALAHRTRRDPLEPAGMDEQRLAEAMDRYLGDSETPDAPDPGPGDLDDVPRPDDQDGSETRPPTERPPAPATPGPAPLDRLAEPAGTSRRPVRMSAASGRGRAGSDSARGRLVGDRAPAGPVGSVAVGATARRAAARRAAAGAPLDDGAVVVPGDIREARRVERTASLIVIAVDASGSMGAPQRMEAAKGATLGLLTNAYQRRDLVALVAFRGDRADVLLRPTSSVEVARARLADLPTGGRTPLAVGILAGLQLAVTPARAVSHHPQLVVVTDGRATFAADGLDPLEAAFRAADAVRAAGLDAVVVDVEATGAADGAPRLGLAGRLADRMGARHVRLPALDPDLLRQAIRDD